MTAVVGAPCDERPRHEAYRQSGEPWIGDVPAHWAVERVKRVAQLASGHTPSRSEDRYWHNCTIPWITLADVAQLRTERIEEIRTTKESISELGVANSAARLLPPGTVVLSRTASVGFSGMMGTSMTTSQDYFNWVCGRRIRPRFLLYCFRAMQHEFRRITDGSTHQTIYWPDAERLTVPVPPLDEQDAIIAFLQHERRKILLLLEAKERMLGLLAEGAEALVTSAILGDPEDQSGGDPAYGWLPKVPRGWRILPLKHLAPFIARGTAPEYVEVGGTPVLGQSCIYWDGLHIENSRRHGEEHVAGLRGLLRRGDVLINSTGTGTLGRAAVFDLPETYLADGHITIVRGNWNEMRPQYLVYLLRTGGYRAFIEQVVTAGSTDQIELSRDKLAATPILLPPPDVQDEIIKRLQGSLEPSLILRALTQQHLELLRNFRQQLTMAAVTGRIRLAGS
jgi:type I restriction enzyme S subunit